MIYADDQAGAESGSRWTGGPGPPGRTAVPATSPRPGMLRQTLLRGAAALAAAAAVMAPRAASARRMTWVAFYGEYMDEGTLSTYDVVVLDPMFRGSVTAVSERGARVCAYLSLGEIRMSDPFLAKTSPEALLAENPAWPGTRRVDVRNQSWKDLVIGELIPAIRARGFTGLMFDTLDTPPFLEESDPVGNTGMRQAAIDLVLAIRAAHPGMMLLMNRGYALLPSVIGNIDGVIAESLLTSSERTDDGRYKSNEPENVALQISLLAVAKGRVPIFSLDYWDPSDLDMIRKICESERLLGHHPYVSTRTLDTVVPCPDP